MSTATVLTELMRACLNDARTLQREQLLVDGPRAHALARMALDRTSFVASLESSSTRPRPERGSWTERFRERSRDLWVGVVGPNSGDSIQSCRRSNSRVAAAYDRALRREWPASTRRLIEGQRAVLAAQKRELDQLQC